jgi:uncharacterized RDD family membrane protein YckC
MTAMPSDDTEHKKFINQDLEYVGFWPRFFAFILDNFFIILIAFLIYFYGEVVSKPTELLEWIFTASFFLFFWSLYQATPGKMLLSAKIIDAKTGTKPTFFQFLIRFLAYIVSAIPLMLGFLWIGIDSKKQGWHDKLAGTIVVRPKPKIVIKKQTTTN